MILIEGNLSDLFSDEEKCSNLYTGTKHRVLNKHQPIVDAGSSEVHTKC